MLILSYAFTYFCILLTISVGQQSVGNLRGKRGKRRDRPNRYADKDNSLVLMKALTINYPLSIFSDIGASRNWRSPAYHSKELLELSNNEKPYADIARAQDQEDIWLYENWFYGMKDGVIMESGALNG